MAGALTIALPFLCDLCPGLVHHPVLPLCLGTAWAGEDDLFAETPEQVKKDIENSFRNAGILLEKEDLRAVRKQLSLINLTIDKHKKNLRRDEIKAYKKRLAELAESVKRKIEALVKENIAIVEKRGQKAGYDFRQMLAVQKGISETDLAPVDQAIVERGTYEENEDASLYTRSSEAAPPIPAVQPPRLSVHDTARVQETLRTEEPVREQEVVPPPPVNKPVITPAPAPALPAHEDNTRSAEQPEERTEPSITATLPPASSQPDPETDKNRALALERAAKVRSLIDAGKIEEAKIVYRIYQQQIEHYSEPDAYKSLKAAVDAATVQDRQQQTQAIQKARAIERLLDQNRIAEAFVEMNKSRETLKPHLDKDVFKALDKNVRQAYIGFIQTQVKANATQRKIRDILAQKNAEKANAAFEAHRVELKTGLSKEAFEALRKDIAAAYAVILDQKKQSEFLCKDIASLIKAGNGAAAWDLFNGNRLLLQQHLDQERFFALESNVQKARNNFLTRQNRAQSLAGAIDSLLDNSRIEEANALFQDIKKRLKTDLADDKRFFEVKDRVSETYADLRTNQRSAVRTSQEIEYLIRLREGRKAYALFCQEEPLLQKYLSHDAAGKLKGSAAKANADYTLQVEKARNTASAIAALMDQKKSNRPTPATVRRKTISTSTLRKTRISKLWVKK